MTVQPLQLVRVVSASLGHRPVARRRRHHRRRNQDAPAGSQITATLRETVEIAGFTVDTVKTIHGKARPPPRHG
jgi:hypothetical protein